MSNDNKPLVSPGVRVILTDETITIVRDGQTVIPEPFRSPLRGVPTQLQVWWDVEYDLLAEWESDPQMFADWEVDPQLIADWEVDGLLIADWEVDPQMFADWEVDPPAEPPVGEIVLLWTESRAAVDSSYMSTVSYGENTYVAGWYNPITQYSSDGTNWSTTGTPAMTLARGSAYGQGKFLMSGTSSISLGPGRLASSTDGTAWVAETNPFTGLGNDSNLGPIIYSPELDLWMLFATGEVGYKTSTDGVTWSATQTIPGLAFTYRGSWGDGKFVVTDTRDLAISTDGVNWTVIPQANHAMDILSDRINATLAHNGMIIALGKSFSRAQGSGMYSTDNGATWNLISVPGHDFILFQAVEYGNDRYIATGSFNIFPSYLVSSTDGINWALEDGFAYSSSGGGYDIVYNSVDNEWVMVGDAGYTARGQYVEVFPPPPIPDPGPPVSGDWSTDLIATTGTSGTQEASPVNIYYRRRLFTTTYTSDEIVAATGKIVATISGLRFLVSQEPLNQPLPDYAIGVKATGNLPSLNNSGTAGGTFTLAKNATDESFTTGAVKEFIFDTPVVWIEGYNLVVSWAWGQVQPDYDASGQMPVGTGNSYHAESDDPGAFNIADEATLIEAHRPVIQLRT